MWPLQLHFYFQMPQNGLQEQSSVLMGDLQLSEDSMEKKLKYILITGASSGIGRFLAINFSHNYNIIIHGRDEEKLLETKSLCNKENVHLIFKLDLKKLDQIEDSISNFISENTIEINHFIHSAGFMKLLPLKTTSLDLINTTFATNVLSAALLIKALSQRKINGEALKTIVFI